MPIDSINNYGAYSTSQASGSTGGTAGKNTLTMDDFLKLFVAKLANQDMYNTVDDTEFMAQMAQFSMLQALSDLSQLSLTSYSVGLIGKEVTVARMNGNTMETITGIVEGVNLFNGSAEIVVEGKAYPLTSVMTVAEPKIIIPNAGGLNQADLIKELAESVDRLSEEINDARANSPDASNDAAGGSDSTDGDASATDGTEDGGLSGSSGEGDV